MANSYFSFKQFTVRHDRCAMKVTTDACLFGAWCSEEIKSGKEISKSLDIGAGSGLLSLFIAQKNQTMIDAIEIDKEAAEQASENVAGSPWKNKINIINEDVLQWQTENKYDCIFSNPPFYETDLKSGKKAKNLAHHDEGLKLQPLLSFIKKHLKEGGNFYLLLPAKREAETRIVLAQEDLQIHQIVYVKQTPGHAPFRLMIKGSALSVEKEKEAQLIIKKDAKNYSPEFIAYLKDYYLYLY